MVARFMVLKENCDPKTCLLNLLIYYEVPVGQRDEVKRKFSNFLAINNLTLRNNKLDHII
jgi:hypothetical protein